MDYDWKYYMDDLRKGKSVIIITEEDRAGAKQIMERLPAEQRKRMEKLVRNMLINGTIKMYKKYKIKMYN